ncbi:MAG: hypothetical protein ABI295_12610 [Xanthomarina sp.]
MKNLKNLGKALSNAEQKTINGGGNTGCPNNPRGMCLIEYFFDIETCTCLSKTAPYIGII